MENNNINAPEALSNDQLEQVSGGYSCWSGINCPKCGTEMRNINTLPQEPGEKSVVVGHICTRCCYKEYI